MSIARSTLIRGPAYVTYKSANFFSNKDIIVPRKPDWQAVRTSMHGQVDMVKTGLLIKFGVSLWGAYENLSILFPSFAMNPIPGTSVFGGSDTPLTLLARNGDQLIVVNAQITKLSNLYLGTDQQFFAADLEFTGTIANSTTPETASAYTTWSTGNSYSDATAAFAKTNFTRTRFLGAWGSVTGFTAMAPQKGVAVDWALGLSPVPVDGYGTPDLTVNDMIGSMSAIAIQPSVAQLKTQSQEETAMGTLLSAASADLVWTGNSSGPVLTLKNAGIVESETAFGVDPLRIGKIMWKGARGFSSGAPAVAASAA